MHDWRAGVFDGFLYPEPVSLLPHEIHTRVASYFGDKAAQRMATGDRGYQRGNRPAAAADATPWPTPYDTTTKYQIQIPPYPESVERAPDSRAWWTEHRPLVLQTGAYGPLKVLDDFAGFRVLSVKNDIIDKIYFVPTGRLEEHNYQLAWDEAIRVQPPRQYRYLERSRPLNAPKAGVGAPARDRVPSSRDHQRGLSG